MAIAPELLAGGAEAGGEGAGAGEGSAVTTSKRMPRQGGYKTPAQVGQLNSDNAEYEDMKRREKPGRTARSYRPVRRSGGGQGRRGGGSSGGRATGSRAATGGLRLVGGAISKAGKPGAVTKLIYAVFAGLVALELASLATGTPFKLHIPAGVKPSKPQTYKELYPGQYAAQANLATKPATVPGVVH